MAMSERERQARLARGRRKKFRGRPGKVTYGKKFRTRRGKFGRYKYVNGKKVAFVTMWGQKQQARKYRSMRKKWG